MDGKEEGRRRKEGKVLTSEVLLNLIKLLASFLLSFSHRTIRLGNELDVLLRRHQRDHIPQNRSGGGGKEGRQSIELTSKGEKDGKVELTSAPSNLKLR